jgi:hypothetical protein
MNFSRDSSGKISSPVRITTGGAGDYEMTFDRGKNGRIPAPPSSLAMAERAELA